MFVEEQNKMNLTTTQTGWLGTDTDVEKTFFVIRSSYTFSNIGLDPVSYFPQEDFTSEEFSWLSDPLTHDSGSSDLKFSKQICDLKQSTGLTWEQIAQLFGVTRRAVHFWVEGGNLSPVSESRLRNIRQLITSMGTTGPIDTRAALFRVDSKGISLYAFMVAEVYSAGTKAGNTREPTLTELREMDSGVGIPEGANSNDKFSEFKSIVR